MQKFVLIVMATLLVLFASTWNEFQSYTWWGDSTGMQGCVNILYNSLAYDKFKVVIVFCSAAFTQAAIVVMKIVAICVQFLIEQLFCHTRSVVFLLTL